MKKFSHPLLEKYKREVWYCEELDRIGIFLRKPLVINGHKINAGWFEVDVLCGPVKSSPIHWANPWVKIGDL